MEPFSSLDTVLVCGVPVLRWRGATDRVAMRSCQQILHALARNGYREMVIDLRQAIASAPREWQRLLNTIEKTLPACAHAEIVLPEDTSPARQMKRARIAPSVTLALSHITRLPVASLQAALTTHVRWQEIRDEE